MAAAPAPAPAQQTPLKMGHHITQQLPALFAYSENGSGQYTLIDGTWTLGALPLAMAKEPYTIKHRGMKLPVTKDILLSTPSDISKAFLDDSCADDRPGYISTALTTLGNAPEAVLRLLLYFMQTGRFNSAKFNNGRYSFDFSTAIIQQVIYSGMSNVRQLALLEMNREFFGIRYNNTMPIKLSDLTQVHISSLANVGYDVDVWKAIFQWAIKIYHTAPGLRNGSKQAIEASLKTKAKEASPLNRAFARHFKELVQLQGEDGDIFRRGEVARFREVVKAYAPKDEEPEPAASRGG